MKLITYARMGKVGFGVIKNGGVIELNDRIGNDVTSIKSLECVNKLIADELTLVKIFVITSIKKFY